MRKIVVLLFLVGITLSSCKVGRFVFYNFPNITDYKIFPSRELTPSTEPFHFYENKDYTKFKESKVKIQNKEVKLDDLLSEGKTVAFLIIRNDTILFEKYYQEYEKESIVASFSVAKSFTSALIGCAIDDDHIKSVDEPVTNYVPELKKNGFEKVTIKHLLQMTSGIKFNESRYNPFGEAATYYYGRTLRKNILRLKLEHPPGERFEYKSGSTQLLGLILERSLKNKTITQYLQEKIWIPLQMENNASWSIDKKRNGIEKTFCCLNVTARDYAKFGRLYLNKGRWNGKQIISSSWIEESITPDLTEGGAKNYKYQWWISRPGKDFAAQGTFGQYIYVNTSKNVIIVRLGKEQGGIPWKALFTSISEGL